MQISHDAPGRQVVVLSDIGADEFRVLVLRAEAVHRHRYRLHNTDGVGRLPAGRAAVGKRTSHHKSSGWVDQLFKIDFIADCYDSLHLNSYACFVQIYLFFGPVFNFQIFNPKELSGIICYKN